MTKTLLAIVFSACLYADTAPARELVGKVVSILDGDTITVLDAENKQHKVRLEGIDAPEERQAFGTRAKQALGSKLHEKSVRVEWDSLDKYKRILGHVYLGERNINKEMVAEGYAWHFKKYSSASELAEAEDAARRGRLGLWSELNPLPPWDFRNSPELAERNAEEPSQAGVVYVTQSGSKYHRAGCRHLTDSARAVPLAEAKLGHQPCKACKPPQ